jgi:DNA polymerase-3 subunit alpha
MGKKDPALMAKFEKSFVGGCASNGVKVDKAQQLWQLIVKFAEYGFNKSHSAAYAVLTYRTAWLKANYPVEFFAANMTCEAGDTDTLKQFLDDARRAGVSVLGPDVNASLADFCVEAAKEGEGAVKGHGLAVRYGLAAIKGMGAKAADAIVEARRRVKRFTSASHLLESVEAGVLHKSAMEALVGAGALDCLSPDRGRLYVQLESVLAEAHKTLADRKAGQKSLFGFGGDDEPAHASAAVKGGQAELWSSLEKLTRERAALGFYFSGHPMERLKDLLTGIGVVPTPEVGGRGADPQIAVAGIVTELKVSLVKSGQSAGQKMARFRLEDLDGAVPVVCFPKTYAECADVLAADGAVVVVRGRLDTRSEEVALVAEGAESAETALARFDGAVVVRLDETEVERCLTELLPCFRERPGRAQVILEIEESSGLATQIRAGEEFRTTPGESLSKAVASRLGPGRLTLARGQVRLGR